jgi:hypothetical protein
MTAPFKKISTWRERIGQTADFPLHVPTDVERAMVAEIAELRAVGTASGEAVPATSFDDYWWEARHHVRTQKEHARQAWEFVLKSVAAPLPQAQREALESVDGDVLPAVGSTVLIHLGRQDAWVEHEVTGYYVWSDLGKNPALHRVFVRVKDAQGYDNARLLMDVRTANQQPVTASGALEPSQVQTVADRIRNTAGLPSGALEDLIAQHRIAITPENEGGFQAHIYHDQDAPVATGYGATPRAAVDAAIADQQATEPGGASWLL